jgi:hypothetical protein
VHDEAHQLFGLGNAGLRRLPPGLLHAEIDVAEVMRSA